MTEHKEESSQDIDLEETGEDNVDEPELDEVEGNFTLKLKNLRAKLKACEEEKQLSLEQLQRTKAEFLNARKRLEEEKLEAKERSVDKLIIELLPMHDSFAAAMGNKDVWQSVSDDWRKGVEAINSQLQRIFTSYNVEPVDPTGAQFDPEHHEAMGYDHVTDKSAHDTVVQVLQVGFVRTVGEEVRTIRPARVIVGNFEQSNDN